MKNYRWGEKYLPGGLLVPIAALILSLTCLVGMFLFFSPSAALSRAMEKTKNAMADREEEAVFLLSRILDGTISFSTDEEEIRFVTEKDRFRFHWFEKDASLTLTSDEAQLLAESETFLSQPLVMESGHALEQWYEPLSSSGTLASDHRYWMGLAAALSDPSDRHGEVLTRWITEAWEAGSSSCHRSREILPVPGSEEKATVYSYRLEGKGLRRSLEALASRGSEEEVRRSLSAWAGRLSALLGKSFGGEQKRVLEEFARGEGEIFQTLLSLSESEENGIDAAFYCKGGAVIAFRLTFSLGSDQGEVFLFLGENVKKSQNLLLSAEWKQRGQTCFFLKWEDEVTEDSEEFFSRRSEFSVTDRVGLLPFLSREETSGQIHITYDKQHSSWEWSLGTRFGQLLLRGQLEKAYTGKETVFLIQQIQKNREDCLTVPWVRVTFSKAGDVPKLPSAPHGVSPDSSLWKEDFLNRYQLFFADEVL